MQQQAANRPLPTAVDNPISLQMKQTLDQEELTNCMRCGFCLPACPTYRETGREASSPRGRIALMKAVVDGHMEAGQQLINQLNQCLGCRACESACPAGVNYGHLLEESRNAIESHVQHSPFIRFVRLLCFEYLFPSSGRMRVLGALLRFYQRSGLQAFVQKTGLLRLLPGHLRQMEHILPEARSTGVVREMGTFVPAARERIGTVGLFRGCIMDVLFTETNKNTVKLLADAGFDVVIPEHQTCCGALQAHSGELETAKRLAKQNIRIFQEAGVDYIISNAGGCGALLVDYEHLLRDEDDQLVQEQASWFASRVRDISQLLFAHLPEEKWGELRDHTITYQASCHLRNGMHVETQPRQILQRIRGAHYVELVEADRCCGSAGIYNIVQPEMSMNLLNEKMEHVKETKAHTLVTSNPGCLLQMKLGIEQQGLSDQMRAVHLVDLLMEARQAVD